jgi:hypothetical protein
MKTVSYHGYEVHPDFPIAELIGELERTGVSYERTEINERPTLLIGSRMRLFWNEETGTYAAEVRAWDAATDAPSDAWTLAEWTAHTSDPRYFVWRNDGIRGWAKV